MFTYQTLSLQSSVAEGIQVNQEIAPESRRIKQNLNQRKSFAFVIREDETLRVQNYLYVPKYVG